MSQEGTVVAGVFACEVDDLDDGETMTVPAEGEREAIAVYRVGEAFYATSDRCTHEKWSLGEDGELEGYEIVCTLHNARFDVRDGAALCFPAVVGLRHYATVVKDGKVFVRLEVNHGG
ncbi:non-heme iron oxygenase ferredoxin subunit [Streptomyces sp. NPDC055092]